MHLKNWNDLRYLLAIERGQTLAAAARMLGVDDTTVSRRLEVLQTALATQLVERRGDSRLFLTPAGVAVARRAEAMEQQLEAIPEVIGSEGTSCAGTVRITSVPLLVNRLLAPSVDLLLGDHPDLVVELIPDSRDLSLTRREADLALRLARPKAGGTSVKARRIGELTYAAYAATGMKATDVRQLSWITYEEAMAHLPQAQWIAKATRNTPSSVSGLRVRDAETALEAAAACQGMTLLPTAVADRDQRLSRIQLDGSLPLPSRDLWLLAHGDQIGLRRISVATEWIEQLLGNSEGEQRSASNKRPTVVAPGIEPTN